MIKLLAHAKINLSLRVLHRRDDGFHEIDSLIQTIDLSDEITVTRAEHDLSVRNDLDIRSEEDLAWQAADLVLREKGMDCGMQITVRKMIPTGAGLGGGSSDAAAVLWAVDYLTPPVLPEGALHDLAAQLGSDVPLFLRGGLLRARGRGEAVSPVFPSRKERFLLLVPPVHCATASVYREMAPRIARSRNGTDEPQLGKNDLYEAAVFLYPELAQYSEAMAKLGADYAGMSGSGSTFYAAFSDAKHAERAHEHLREELPQAQVYLTQATSTGFHVKGGK